MEKKNTQQFTVFQYRAAGCESVPMELIGEEPFSIHVDDAPYSVVMRTPGDEAAHAVGFCLGEGIVNRREDIETIGYDPELESNVINIWLTPGRREKVRGVLNRRGYISQTSCGICGKEMLRDIQSSVHPADDGDSLPLEQIFACIRALPENQQYYRRTRGSHAAMLMDLNLSVLAFAEDVGRHNALDKVIGKALMENTLPSARILVLSSRISYELVQKAARARLPIMIGNSRPTALAAQMGEALNMTLAFPAGEGCIMVVCGEKRIIRSLTDPKVGTI